MNKIKDENFNSSAKFSSDLTDDQTTTTLCLHPLYDTMYIYYKNKMKAF